MSLFKEIIVDNFAGGGGASTGIEMATGRSVDIAINHDPDAIAMHKTNHPDTEHFCESVWDINPREAVNGRPVALVWLSPDCKHFSKAKGGKPVEKKIRGLAWIALKWAATVKPRVIMLENVEEFQTWGPLIDGKPCPKRKGRTFASFKNALRRQGYIVEHRELKACDYGAPTIRKRLFLVARRDGQKIIWPKPTHGDPKSKEVKSGKLQPWRTAAECIDWSLPCPSIFERKKPLAENTLKRIAKGIQRFVIDSPDPFIVVNTTDNPPQSIFSPLKTVTTGNHHYLVTPTIARQFGASLGHKITDPLGTITPVGMGKSQLVAAFLTRIGQTGGHGHYINDPNDPLTTITTKAEHLFIAANLCKHYGGGYTGPGSALTKPVPTVTSVDHTSLVTSHMIKLKGSNIGQQVNEPIHTITAGGLHFGEVRAFLLKYYGTNIGHKPDQPLQTITAKHRFGLVTVAGEDYQIVDIGMRMLQPHELFKAQGFPDNYIINVDHTGKAYPKAKQVARCGNAVPPPFAEHLVRANLPELCQQPREVAA